MDVTTRNRKELKSYFVKNSIPTESNFAELIDGLLNQKDDGLVKLPGNPLSVEAAGDSTSEKKALQIYQSFNDQSPAWSVSLNPRASAGDATSARPGLNISDGEGRSRLFIDRNSGNAGLGTISPVAKLDVLSVTRSGAHPAAVKGLYVTGDFGAASDGVEFRHSDGTQGIGFGSNTIYAAGSNANQDLGLKARGTGVVRVQGSLQVTGAITPSAGNTSGNGIMFPTDPFGGSGDSAWVRYHNARGGEKGTLEIGIGNDADDHISLAPSGGVGVGSVAPEGALDINKGNADAQVDASSNALSYGTEKADLILTRRHSPTKSLNGYTASLIDFRATNTSDEWSAAQILGMVELNSNAGYSGGLAILTSPGGTTDATGRRTKGAAPIARMVVDSNGNVGIGTTSPAARLEISGSGGTNVDLQVNGRLRSNNNDGGLWISTDRFVGGHSTNKLGVWMGEWRLTVQSDGNVGIGATTPVARLDVLSAARSGTHPTAIKGLYVTGDFGADSDGVEFRRSNATQGIGFGYNTIYASGSDANQDLGLKARGAGVVKVQSSLQVSGAITPSLGNTSSNGIMFPTNPFGGTTDSAWVRYHNARGGENGTLEIGIGNDADDHIALVASGGVGIGSAAAESPLDINRGTADAQADITPTTSTYGAEKADLILTRRHSATKSLYGYPASLIDFRVTNAIDEWSVAQLLAVVDLNQNPTNWGGGLAILTASGGATDTGGRRTKGGAMTVRMVVDGNGNVGIGTASPQQKLAVDGYVAAKQVYFSAYLDLNTRTGAQDPLPMQQTSQNVGGAYSTSTSKFTAPVKGVYLFTMTGNRVNDSIGNSLLWYLMVNGASANSGGTTTAESDERCLLYWPTNVYGTASRTILVALNAGDLVHVKQTGSGRCDNYSSSLEGTLLYATL